MYLRRIYEELLLILIFSISLMAERIDLSWVSELGISTTNLNPFRDRRFHF